MLKFFTKYNKKNAYDTLKGKEVFPDGISRNARNELRKYAATFYNNTAVALFAAGFLIPILSISPKMALLIKEDFEAGKFFNITPPIEIAGVILASVLAFLIAGRFRTFANRCLITLEDSSSA
jgi:hypothetical protein